MKMLFAVAALASMIAASTFAQAAPRRAAVPAVNPSIQVWEGGQYVGSDPDPNVRLMLRRDYDSHD